MKSAKLVEEAVKHKVDESKKAKLARKTKALTIEHSPEDRHDTYRTE